LSCNKTFRVLFFLALSLPSLLSFALAHCPSLCFFLFVSALRSMSLKKTTVARTIFPVPMLYQSPRVEDPPPISVKQQVVGFAQQQVSHLARR
jgi:hypothetical protein